MKLGTFQVESGRLRVTDPCYEPDTWCAGVIENVKKGDWKAFVSYYGHRPNTLIAVHKDHAEEYKQLCFQRADFSVGVDSGQAGIFDANYYGANGKVDSRLFGRVARGGTAKDAKNPTHEEEWYAQCCSVTLGERQAGAIPYGAVSASGYGDGSYSCYTAEFRGKIIAVYIDFMGEEEEETA